MIHKVIRLLRETANIYMTRQIPRSAAALSYYLTMSVFPLVICLYTLLGSSYGKMVQVLEFLDQFLAPETTRYIKSFLVYVAQNRNPAMLLAGLLLLLTSASAATRAMHLSIAEMQGGRRYRGLWDILFSLVFSVAFVAAMYFAIVVMLTGHEFLELIESKLPFIHISRAWGWMRFLLLGGIELVVLWAMFEVMRRRDLPYRTWPGAIVGTLAVVLMCWVFSEFIAVSARYSLVYSSLASLILLMFWLFLCCQMIYVGAAFNIAVWKVIGSVKRGHGPEQSEGSGNV